MNIQDVLARIEDSNESFNQAELAVKRMMIAQDCIDRIQSNQLSAKHNSGFINPTSDHLNNMIGLSIKDSMTNPTFECKVCAKGGLFLSYIGRVNQVDWYIGLGFSCQYHTTASQRKLQEIFSAKQLTLIEFAYEGYLVDTPAFPELTKECVSKYISDYRLPFVTGISPISSIQLHDKEAILIDILNNIITNGGTFILPGVSEEHKHITE